MAGIGAARLRSVPSAGEVDQGAISHNLLGQRLGRKGRDTRDRILAATDRLLADPAGTPVSLSAVARDASLGMTTLYLYFSDLTELLLAVLDPIMASAEDAYVAAMRVRWADETLRADSIAFVDAFHAFWQRHSRILHLRNSFAADRDERMVRHRVSSARPLIGLLVAQMDADPADMSGMATGLATALLTGIERLVTVTTDATFLHTLSAEPRPDVPNLLHAQARLLELGIRHARGEES